METILNILSAIFYIAETQGQELCLSTETGTIYRVLEKGSGTFTLLSLGEDEAATSYFSADSLIFRTDILQRSEKIGKLTARISLTMGQQQSDNGTETEIIMGNQRNNNGNETATSRSNNGGALARQQQLIGEGKVNLPRISTLYTGQISVVLYDIEEALNRIFFATNKDETIKKFIAKYNQVVNLAKCGQLYELNQILKSLLGTIEKQKAMGRGVEKMNAKQKVKETFVKSLIVIFFVAFGVLWFWRPWREAKPEQTNDTATEQTTTPAATTTTKGDAFEEALAEFQATTGKKVWPKGEECLRRACKGKNKKQCLAIIKANVK